jgi:hypothetical protein
LLTLKKISKTKQTLKYYIFNVPVKLIAKIHPSLTTSKDGLVTIDIHRETTSNYVVLKIYLTLVFSWCNLHHISDLQLFILSNNQNSIK